MRASVAALEWVGAHARWVLFIGCLTALAFPAAASTMRPLLPALVAMVYALGMARVDLPIVARNALRPRRAAVTLGLSALMLTVTAAAGWWLVLALGMGPDYAMAVVYAFASPPIASAAAMCFLLGLNAAMALELTVVASLVMPVIGPAVVYALLGAAVPIAPLDLMLRVGAMVAAGAVMAVVIRRVFGPARIARSAKAFDGVSAIALLIFVIPVFDGVGETIAARPGLALGMLGLSSALIFGPHLLLRLAPIPTAEAGASAVVWGTRSVAIYLAALPYDPVFALFCALYQLPMYATPLVLGRFYRA